MSGSLRNIVAGRGAYASDGQAVADAAAAADDLVYGALCDLALKSVTPLRVESASETPRLLAQPGTGGNAGKVGVYQAHYIANVTNGPGFGAIDLAHSEWSLLMSSALPTTALAGTNYCAVYVTLQRTVSSTATRVAKADDGSISSSTVNVATAPTATISVTAYNNTDAATALTAIPADTATAWCFPICTVAVTHPYMSGTLLAQSAITQQWVGGGVPQERVRAKVLSGAVTQTPLTSRWASNERWIGVVLNSAATQTITIDSTLDWRLRHFTALVSRAQVDGGNYLPPQSVSLGGTTLTAELAGYTGDDGGTETVVLAGAGGAGVDQEISLYADAATGALKVYFAAAPADAAPGDNWLIQIDTTPRFEF